MNYKPSLLFARSQDEQDPLKSFRKEFYFPQINGKKSVYLCGNSLGLQPKSYQIFTNRILNDWKTLGVEGHFEGDNPWVHYGEKLKGPMAEIVGGKKEEIAIMNMLTVNLHLLMVSFYRPNTDRYKILIENDAFPSDKYVVESQVALHGFNPRDAIIQIGPDNGELMSDEHIINTIKQNGKEIALILLGGVNYYTGQFLDIQEITKAGHKEGCVVGFDMAHAAGNIPLNLHEHKVDFAAWCTYKYMNSGPGNLAGCFIHEKHHNNTQLPKFTGWWGHKLDTRFNMRIPFDPERSAEGWVLSNPPVMALAGIHASLELFQKAGMEKLRKKSVELTGFLEYLIQDMNNDSIRIITPSNPEKRGAQLSVQVINANKELFYNLKKKGVITDWREPDVIRVSPAPLYNSFEDVFNFVEILKGVL